MNKVIKTFLMSILTATVLLQSPMRCLGQSAPQVSQSNTDYSNFISNTKTQSWVLTGVSSNEFYTAIFIRINVISNKEGAFMFPKDISISGDFGTYEPLSLTVDNGKEFEFGKNRYYPKGNKNTGSNCMILFPRIPAGVTSFNFRYPINFTHPNGIMWEKIPLADNPNTAEQSLWDDSTLRSHWEENDITSIEGIYYFATTNGKEWWGNIKHTLAVVMDGYQYKVVYLKGSNPKIWKPGEIKGTFIATATPGLYKATNWLMENKMPNENFYLSFTGGAMSIYEENNKVTADFIKLYPANDINLQNKSNNKKSGSTTNTPSQNPTQHTSSGSGIFIAPKIIATNYHVIDGAEKIEILIKSGEDVNTYTAKVLCSDKTNDLALLSLDKSEFNGMNDIPFSISTNSREVGTSIFTMGYPMADYIGDEVKITDGIISSKTGYDGDIVTYQISAPIQPGSSGGPLFDKHGELIGITNAGIMAAQNVGYAIKSSYLHNLIEAAPININIQHTNLLSEKDLTEQIKILSKYVVLIRIY